MTFRQELEVDLIVIHAQARFLSRYRRPNGDRREKKA
jgi:hypothetical protein